jgi:hypothetical protein
MQFVFDEKVSGLRAAGARVASSRNGTRVIYDIALAGSRLRFSPKVSAPALPASLPSIRLTAVPSPPSAVELVPPRSHDSWASALQGGAISRSAAFDRLIAVLAETAQLPNVDGYLGNPDRDGPTSTIYRYRVVERKANSVLNDAGGGSETSPTTLPTFVLVLGLGLILFATFVWWAYS